MFCMLLACNLLDCEMPPAVMSPAVESLLVLIKIERERDGSSLWREVAHFQTRLSMPLHVDCHLVSVGFHLRAYATSNLS